MGKTTLGEKIGYGFASLGDAASYGFMGVFLLFFLTTVAGISPAIAGTISAVGAVWNAIFNPIMGYLADKVRTRYGRRRPVMFAFSIPLALAALLLFTNMNLPMSIKPVYYGFMAMFYWTCYSGFFIPYLALGAEYTSDYDDRTVLRLFSSFFNMLGTMFSMVMPTMIVAFLEGLGMSTSQAWSATGGFIGVLSSVTIIITVLASGHKDLPCQPEPEHGHMNLKTELIDIFKEYVSVAKLKPAKYLVAASLFSLIAYSMIMSDMVYMFTYNKGLSSGAISACLMLRSVLGIVLIPITGKLVLKTDKRETLIGAYIFGAVGMFVMKFADIPGVLGVGLYVLFATICTAIYWQIMPGIFYDVCEYDKVINHKNRSATIVSFQGLVEALASGIGGQILGLILESAGFDGEAAVQSENAQVWIESSGTIIPVLFLMVACVALYKYPITKKYYNEMIKDK